MQTLEQQQQLSQSAPPSQKPLILLVEDEQQLRELLGKILNLAKFRVICATSYEDGLELWQKNQSSIKILIVDYLLGSNIKGTDLVKQCRLTNPALNVLLISGLCVEDIDLHLQEGTNFLQKPFSPTKLISIIHSMLARP